MHYALKFGYNGRNYLGYARQPELLTIEGEIIEALLDTKIIEDIEGSRLRAASRTDKGVSALGNVLSVFTDFREDEILPALNSQLDDIWFYALVRVSEDFNPRHAKERWYRYLVFDKDIDIEKIRETADHFVGTHNFTNFAKLEGNDPVRIINSIEVSSIEGGIFIDVKAQSFLWHMIRRIVGAILGVEKGNFHRNDIIKALDGPGEMDLGMAAAEPLILMDVTYDLEFQKIPLKKLNEDLEKKLGSLKLETLFYKQLRDIIS